MHGLVDCAHEAVQDLIDDVQQAIRELIGPSRPPAKVALEKAAVADVDAVEASA